MNPSHPSPPESAARATRLLRSPLTRAAVLLALAAAIVGYLHWFSGRDRTTPELREKFFQEQVSPHITRNHQANAAAVDRFKAGVHAQFSQYRQRVPAFVDDITGWGNRIKIAYEGTKEFASADKQKVERHVAEKFAMHIAGADALQRDLQRLLVEFRQGIDANRNEMLAGIQAAVASEPALELRPTAVSDTFLKEIDARLKSVSHQAGKDSVQVGGLTLLTSVLTEEATRIAVTSVLSRIATAFGTSAAASAATAGGATAASTGVGATGGSAAGPIGTAAGVVIGIGVGLVVDWIMTNRLEAQLAKQCEDFLNKTELAITTGATSVAAQLEWAVNQVEQATPPILRQQLGILP